MNFFVKVFRDFIDFIFGVMLGVFILLSRLLILYLENLLVVNFGMIGLVVFGMDLIFSVFVMELYEMSGLFWILVKDR